MSFKKFNLYLLNPGFELLFYNKWKTSFNFNSKFKYNYNCLKYRLGKFIYHFTWFIHKYYYLNNYLNYFSWNQLSKSFSGINVRLVKYLLIIIERFSSKIKNNLKIEINLNSILRKKKKIKNKFNINKKLIDFFIWYQYIYIYFNIEFTNLYKFLFLNKFHYDSINFFFLLNFHFNNKIYFNFITKKKNLTSLSTGLFIKFFEKKKSLKKSKLLKLLIIKYFKKLFIILNLKKFILIIKKNPILLFEIINLLFKTPIIIKKIKKIFYKIKLKIPTMSYLFFLENKSYTINKLKQTGRIKRKIMKKLIIKNHIID